jgi:cell division protein FtsB
MAFDLQFPPYGRRLWPVIGAVMRGIGPFLRHKWPILALFVFYFYLAFHALSGNQGLMRWVDYQADITRNSAALEQLQAEREALQIRADSLAADNLNIDILDAQSRESLFVSHPNEYTIWLDQTP